MFDIIFDAFSAWNQIGLFIMAFVFILIGGSIVGYEMSWRLKGMRVKARVKDIRATGAREEEEHAEDMQKRLKEKLSPFVKDEDSSEPLNVDVDKTEQEGVKGKAVGSVFVLLFLAIPLIFTGIGVYMGYNYIHLTQTGEYADATVIRNDSSRDSEGSISYKAILKFKDARGRTHEVRDSISYNSSPSYPVNTKIGVYYRADDPTDFVIHDFWHHMTIAIFFVIFGSLFILIFGFALLFGKTSKDNSNLSRKERLSRKHNSSAAYYPVYEYKAPNGERMEHIGTVGSYSMLSFMPGTAKTLLMKRNNPQKVKKPSTILLIIGVVFFLPGLLIGNVALQQEFNYMTVLIILGGAAFVAFKIWRFIQSIPKDEWDKGWADFKENGVQVTSSKSKSKGRVLNANEIAQRVKKQASRAQITGVVFLLIAAGLSGGAYYAGLDMLEKTQNGVRADGEVVSIESRYSSTSDSSGYTYYAVVKFFDDQGRSTRFQDNVGSSTPLYKRGDEVTVLYDPMNSDKAMIDRGLMNWGLSGGLALAVLFSLWIAFYNLMLSRRYGATKYRSRI